MSQQFKSFTAEQLQATIRKEPKPQPRKSMPPATPIASTPPAPKAGNGFVNADELLVTLFPSETSRPSARWIRDRTQAGDIPSVKLGGLTFYDVVKVRAVLNGEVSELTEAQVASMGETELWAQYGKLLETKGASVARNFYKKHIERIA